MINVAWFGEHMVGTVALAALIFFASFIPTSWPSYPDPINITDKRVRAVLTDDDLRNVMRVVRRGRVNSIYEMLRFRTRSPLLLTAETPESHVGRIARLEVMVGDVCGPECGSGEVYYLGKTNGRWHVAEITEWVS